MAKYLFVYHGGGEPSTPRDARKITRRWNNWFVSMGYAVGDGGNPVGLWTTVHPDGSVTNDGNGNPASGYSMIDAASDEDATEKARRCPILETGGTVDIAPICEPM
jgi:hypothetical protein